MGSVLHYAKDLPISKKCGSRINPSTAMRSGSARGADNPERAYFCVAALAQSKEDSIPKHALPLLLVACLFAGTLWAADDPFVGKWKLNPSKSKLTEEMKVESVG